jgi:hypothetical protein
MKCWGRILVGVASGAGLVVPGPAWAQAAAAAKPPVMTHVDRGREQCLMCHGGAMQGIKSAPKSHEGRSNDVCLLCHAKDAPIQTKAASAVSHQLQGRQQCMVCHGGAMEGITAAPTDHKGIDVKNCTLCHAAAT